MFGRSGIQFRKIATEEWDWSSRTSPSRKFWLGPNGMSVCRGSGYFRAFPWAVTGGCMDPVLGVGADNLMELMARCVSLDLVS